MYVHLITDFSGMGITNSPFHHISRVQLAGYHRHTQAKLSMVIRRLGGFHSIFGRQAVDCSASVRVKDGGEKTTLAFIKDPQLGCC